MTDAFDELFGQKTEEPENEFDMLFRQQSDTQKVRGTLDVVSQDSPDEMARAFDIADKRGLDPLAVKENLGEIERQEKVGGIDLEDLKKNNPALFKMLQDPRKAAVSHDSVDNLSMIERLVVKQWDIDRSFVAGSTDFLGRGTHGASETIQAYTLDPLIGITTRSLEGIAGAEKGTALGDLFGRIVRATSPIVHIGEAGQKVKDLSDFIRPPAERQNLATDIAEGVGQISSQLLVSVFAPEVGIPMLFGQGADIQDERLAEKGITDGNRRRAALAIGGGITAVTEKIALDKLLDRIPPKIKSKVLQKLADIGIASGIEAVQEVVEGIGHNLATFGLYDREQQIFVPEEAQREALAAGGAAGFVRAFLQGVLPGRMRIDAAEDHAEHLRNLGEEVRKSPVFARRKQVVSELIREASGGQQVYLPVAETVQLFQSKVPGFDLAENFEWAQDEIDAALEIGTDLPVDLGKFAEQADSPAYDGMVELVRRTPEEPNFVETANRQFQAALDDEYRKAVQASENEAQEARASLTIGNTVSRYLTDVGLSSTVSRDIGTAYQAFFETLETKGANAEEIFQKLGLRVERELPASIARSTDEIDVLLNELRSGKLPSQVEAFGPSLIDFLREQGVADDRGDLQALDIDKGLRPGQRKLLREDGRSLDDLALSAYEAGYFPRFAGRPDVNQLLEAVDRETRGEATFSADLGNTRVRARREALDDLQSELDRRGLSTDQTNEELRAALLSEQSDGDANILNQFAGQASASADLLSLEEAKAQADRGINAELTRQKTGWFKGSDGKWRYEISDDEARLINPKNFVDPLELGELLDHPKLYAAYPSLATMRVEFFGNSGPKPVLSEEPNASFIPSTDTITLHRGLDPDQALSSLLHEVQHVIQRREGFARGGNLEITKQVSKALNDLARGAEQDVEAWKWANLNLLEDADAARRMAGYALLYKSREQLINYAHHDRPSSVFRNIRNQSDWLYSPIIRDSADLSERASALERKLYELPKRHKMNERNAFLREYSMSLAALLGDAIPADVRSQFKADGRRLDGLVKALERQAAKASKKIKPLNELQQRARKASELAEVTEFKTSFNVYQSLAGEVEARNTQKRANFTAEQRKTTPPRATQDTPESEVVVVFQDGEIDTSTMANIEASPLFQSDNRASVEIPVTGILSDQNVVVRLTQASDLSSFLHESGHIFLEIYKSLAPEHEAINEEYQKILAWLGATDGNITTEHHEKFAEGFETWLFEGKSPSEDMRFTFARFRAWLTRVYKDIANMRIQLNDEAREIFNNMFATEEAIKAAYASAQFDADPTLLELMTDAEKAGLEKARAKARMTSEESVLRETIRETERRRSKEYKEEAKKVKAEVADNVWSQPIYQAWHLLTKGKLYNEDTPAELENIKLSRGAIVEMRGEGFLPGLPRGFNHIYRKEGGVHPDQIATLFGFQSGDELLDKLANSPKPTDLIEAETQAEMVSRHGDIKTDGTIEREATEAVYNLDAERFLRIEQKMLARKAGKEATSLSVLKQTAKRLIESRPRKEVIKPGRYAINSQRAARQAVRAAAEGDFETALQQKERQILNHELSRLAYQAREDYTKKRAYLDKVVRKKYDRKSMAPEYIGQAKRLIGLYYGLSQTPEADALSLQAWKTETDNDPAKASGDIPIDVILFDPNNPDADKIPHIDDLSMEKLRDLYLSVRMIEKAGRKESDLENDGYLQEATALAENVLANNKVRKKPKVFRDEPGEAETLRTGYVNAIERMSTIIDQLDGYVEGFGLFREKIWKGIRAGVNESERIHRLMHDQIVKAFEGMKPSELRRKVYVSEVNETFTIEEIMMMAQQTGSESNYQALLDDLTKNKDAQFSEDQIWAILDRLDKKHWDVVQNVWNVFEYWRPFVFAQAEKLDGVPPPRVEPVEVQTRHGTYAGGYFRLKYSQLPGEKGFDEMAKEQAARNSGGAFAREATNKGMLQQRKGSGGRRIVYNYTSLTKSLDETANMLAFREPMDRAARILNKRVLREAIIDTLGEQRLHTINNMFIRIGAGYIDPHGSIAPILRKLRIGAMMADLGFNLRTWATQWLGVFQSLELLTMGELAHGYADYVAKGYKFAFDRSEFMRSRPITRQRELLEQSRRRGLSGRLSKAQEISMIPLGTIDTFTVALPTWYAAYYKGVQKLGMTEKDAVLYADQIVSDTQSAGQITEMALLQTGNEIEKGFTYMWGYFSTTYNLTLRRARREALRVREAEGVAKAPALTVAGFNMTMTVMKLYAIPGVLAALMLEHWPGDDNDEDWPEWLAWALANQSLGVLPMLRDIPREVRYAFGGGGTLSSDRFFGSISDVIKGSIKTGKSYYVDDDLEVDPQLIKGLARAMAQYYGIPGTNQAIRIVDDVLLDDDPTFWEATMIGKDQDN